MYSKEKIDAMYARKLLRIETRGGSGKVKKKCYVCGTIKGAGVNNTFKWVMNPNTRRPIWVHSDCWERRGV